MILPNDGAKGGANAVCCKHWALIEAKILAGKCAKPAKEFSELPLLVKNEIRTRNHTEVEVQVKKRVSQIHPLKVSPSLDLKQAAHS